MSKPTVCDELRNLMMSKKVHYNSKNRMQLGSVENPVDAHLEFGPFRKRISTQPLALEYLYYSRAFKSELLRSA